MDAVIASLLAALVLLLFYRFVERRHKVLLGKLALGALLLAACIVAALRWQESRSRRQEEELAERRRVSRDSLAALREDRDRNAVSVTFLPESTRRSVVRRNWLGERLSDTVQTVAFRFCHVSQHPDTIDAVVFRARKWRPGRSSRFALYASYTVSDLILPPGKCGIDTVTLRISRVESLDSVEAEGRPIWRKPDILLLIESRHRP